MLGFSPLLGDSVKWEPDGSETIWITVPQFENRDGQTHTWNSRVSFVQMFKATGQERATLLTSNADHLRVIIFNVRWTAKIKNDGRFYEIQLKEIEFADKSFAPPTADELRQYQLEEDEPRGEQA